MPETCQVRLVLRVDDAEVKGKFSTLAGAFCFVFLG